MPLCWEVSDGFIGGSQGKKEARSKGGGQGALRLYLGCPLIQFSFFPQSGPSSLAL